MVTIVKHEWHQVDHQACIELDEDLLSEIYPDLDEDEIANLLKQIEEGEVDVEDVINEAWENDIDIDWDHQYDDWWTMRKGGYDVTYELGDESSWVEPDKEPEPTHKCTKCKWKGQSYDADWVWPEENSDEEAKKICPYCESDLELTEHGVVEEEARAVRMAEIDAMFEEEEVPCFSCGAMHKESELPEIKESGYYCPDCRENWVMMDNREEELEVDVLDLEDALEELKREFDTLADESDKDDTK